MYSINSWKLIASDTSARKHHPTFPAFGYCAMKSYLDICSLSSPMMMKGGGGQFHPNVIQYNYHYMCKNSTTAELEEQCLTAPIPGRRDFKNNTSTWTNDDVLYGGEVPSGGPIVF